MNDVISAVPGTEAECLLSHLNSVELSIQFTLEREKDIHFPFLDLNVSRGVRGNWETKVYRKLTHTDKYLAFDSHHPICHKKSVAKTLLRRADCLPSWFNSKAEERKCVSNVLKANGSTKTFLRSCQKPVTTSNTPDEREPATGFAVIPCIQGVTEPIKRILNSHNVKLLRNLFRLWGIFLPFIGQTKRQFGTRLKEHHKSVFFCKENLALSEHTCLTNHAIGWDKSKIITTNRRYHQRLCLDAWHVNSTDAPLNCDDDGLLPDAYLHLVKKKKPANWWSYKRTSCCSV